MSKKNIEQAGLSGLVWDEFEAWLHMAETRPRRLNAPKLPSEVSVGIEFKGTVRVKQQPQEAAA